MCVPGPVAAAGAGLGGGPGGAPGLLWRGQAAGEGPGRLTRCALAQGLAGILAAMAPCSRLYGFLGCQLALAYPGASHQYSHWIDTYSSPEYLVGGPCGGRGLPADAVA
jgi:hypothetical protein